MSKEQIILLRRHGISVTENQLEVLKGLPLHNVTLEFIIEIATICNILYRAGMPVVEDYYYDEVIIAELVKRDPDHPFLNTVEPDALLGKTKPLPQPMLSTHKAYTEKDIRSWLATVVKTAQQLYIDTTTLFIRITPKLDGYACYDDGKTLYTRGDGQQGTDITFILDRGVEAIGTRIEGPGEIVVNKQYFEEHLADSYENSRNFIGSVIREQQLSLLVQRACIDKAIVFQPFSLLPAWQGTITELLNDYNTIIDSVWHLTHFDVDGVVLEVIDNRIKDMMGSTRHHHKWQIAFKRNELSVEVPVLDVVYQTGKTGVITPVAELVPTTISGVTVSRATAHNAGHVLKWSLGKGSVVKVVRAGLVIPKIIDVVKPGIVNIPTACPSCGASVGWENDRLFCSNLTSCPAQVENQLLYFFQTLGTIDGFGAKTIETLCQNGIQSLSSIYSLTEATLRDIGFGPGESSNLIKALNKSLLIPVNDWRFLAAFGIPYIGRGGCELLLKHYPLLEVFNLTKEQIVAIKGFANKSADVIVNTLKVIKPEFDKIYALKFTLKITPIGGNVTQQSSITGKSVVFTGTMSTKTREVMENEAKALGARVGSTVTSKTDYLIIGSEPGASKLKAAEQHSTTVLNEQEYWEMLNE